MALQALIHRKRHTWWQRFQASPSPTLATTLYALRQCLLREQTSHRTSSPTITVVCVSDTHNTQPPLPPGDILIHAGDLTQGGTAAELQQQLDWLDAQPHAHKVVIAGNHDIVLDDAKAAEFGFPPCAARSLRWGSIIYLQHSETSCEIHGRCATVFGHPETPKHGNWAFQYDRSRDVFTHQVADDVDILVTHSAPRFHLDVAGWGDGFLLQELWRVRPKVHVFGHIHEGFGRDVLVYDRFEREYVRVCAGSAGMVGLLHMLVLLLLMVLTGAGRDAQRTVLVNAAVVGGTLDQQRRQVQVVKL